MFMFSRKLRIFSKTASIILFIDNFEAKNSWKKEDMHPFPLNADFWCENCPLLSQPLLHRKDWGPLSSPSRWGGTPGPAAGQPGPQSWATWHYYRRGRQSADWTISHFECLSGYSTRPIHPLHVAGRMTKHGGTVAPLLCSPCTLLLIPTHTLSYPPRRAHVLNQSFKTFITEQKFCEKITNFCEPLHGF